MKKLLSLAVLLLAQAMCFGQSLKFDSNGNGIWGMAGSVDVRSCYQTNYWFGNLAAGVNDLYTAASTNIVWILPCTLGTTNAVTVTTYIKTNSVYTRAAAGVGVTTASAPVFTFSGAVLMPNETLALSNSVIGLNFVLSLALFDTSSHGVIPVLSTFTGGYDLFYTVPNGRRMVKLAGDGFVTTAPTYVINNDSGASAVYSVYYVPAGGSPGDDNRFVSVTVNNAASSSFFVTPRLGPGESIYVQSSSTSSGQSVRSVGFFEEVAQ